MTITQLKFRKSSQSKKKRVGRGNGSGWGGECGRGHKGQKSRSGYNRRYGFEGGQNPLYRRIPKKRGFRNHFKVTYSVLNLNKLDKFFEEGETVDNDILQKRGLIKLDMPYKILGFGKLTKQLTIRAHAVSKLALEKLKSTDTKVEIIDV